MSNSAQTSASKRINALLDENSFVEIGAYVTARSTDFNLTDRETPEDGVITGYGTMMRLYWAVPSARCTQRKFPESIPWQ